MTIERMIELLETECLCVKKNVYNACDRDCENCELVQDAEEIITMYSCVISMLQAQPNHTEKVEKAYWIVRRNSNYATCSNCSHSYIDVYDLEDFDNYCRHCGAKMVGIKCDD